MRNFFDSFRHYTNLSPDQLLIEGRKDDVAKKYPELARKRDALDGESVLDTLIQADPSGNQKYLMGAAKILHNSMENAKAAGYGSFWGKKWPEDAPDNLYSPWGVGKNIAGDLEKFHKLQPLIPQEKRDINSIQNYSELQNLLTAATEKQQDKERKKAASERERTQAGEESHIVADNDQYTMIRPTTAHASCYYGKGTKWCISATQSGNYFDEYTSEGKSFYFVFFANISNVNPFKKIALVVGMDGSYDEAFNAEDDSLYPAEVVDAIIQNMLYEKEDAGALMTYRYYDNERHVDELTDADKADYVKKIKELLTIGARWDDALASTDAGFKDQAEQANHNIRTLAHKWFQEMKDEAEQNHQEAPPGPSDEEYNELLSAYMEEANNIDVSLQFPYDTGASAVMWDSNAYVDVADIIDSHPLVKEKRLKWRINPEQTTDEQDEEIKEAVDSALTYIDIWPDGMEPGYNTVFEFHIQIASEGGSLDELESFLDNTLYQDNKWDADFVEGLIEALEESKLIGRDEREEEYWPDPEEKEKQIELPLSESRGIRLIIRRK